LRVVERAFDALNRTYGGVSRTSFNGEVRLRFKFSRNGALTASKTTHALSLIKIASAAMEGE